MDDIRLERYLQSVGKEVFATYYDQFANPSLSNTYLLDLLVSERGYTLKACRTRVSKARSIINAGRGSDALRRCAVRKR